MDKTQKEEIRKEIFSLLDSKNISLKEQAIVLCGAYTTAIAKTKTSQ